MERASRQFTRAPHCPLHGQPASLKTLPLRCGRGLGDVNYLFISAFGERKMRRLSSDVGHSSSHTLCVPGLCRLLPCTARLYCCSPSAMVGVRAVARLVADQSGALHRSGSCMGWGGFRVTAMYRATRSAQLSGACRDGVGHYCVLRRSTTVAWLQWWECVRWRSRWPAPRSPRCAAPSIWGSVDCRGADRNATQ